MSTDQLFDISSIDLDDVFLTPDKVAECNPQRGDMRHLDHVIYMDDGASKALGVKMVKDDEFWVPGHIPGRPLLPAVLMIEAAAQLSSILYQYRTKEAAFLAIFVAKYLQTLGQDAEEIFGGRRVWLKSELYAGP